MVFRGGTLGLPVFDTGAFSQLCEQTHESASGFCVESKSTISLYSFQNVLKYRSEVWCIKFLLIFPVVASFVIIEITVYISTLVHLLRHAFFRVEKAQGL